MRIKRLSNLLIAVVTALCAAISMAQQASPQVPLQGHVLPALVQATAASLDNSTAQLGDDVLTLTVVLRRSDPDRFAQYLKDVYDASSPQYLRFLTPVAVTERFGPSADDFAAVSAYFSQQGFRIGEGSANRMTLTMYATRAAVERALSVHIGDYRIGARTFYANSGDPLLPQDIAARVEAVTGLSNLAQPTQNWDALMKLFKEILYELCKLSESVPNAPGALNTAASGNTPPDSQCVKPAGVQAARVQSRAGGPVASGSVAWGLARGAGQKVGLLEFDSFAQSDVSDFLNLVGMPPSAISKLTQVHVNGGATLGSRQDEVLLDITSVMLIATGAQVVVYNAPFAGGGTSFQGLLNAMVNDSVTVISNSWSYCEDQTTLADAQSIDTILQTAAASGIGVFNASGDSGSTCLDGSPNTAGLPASSPHATAVGGSSLTTGPGSTYVSEQWWNGSADTPPTGQGGFGVSRFFSRPAYQNGFVASAMRSVPDVVANADPAKGVFICEATNGGCPNGLSYGGTSVAAPIWAAYAAVLNEAQGRNLGNLNPLIYPLAATPAFHGPGSLGTDFAHVGLGSPNLNLVNLGLSGNTAGAPVATMSSAVPYTFGAAPTIGTPPANPPADGSSPLYVVVWLRDIDGNMVSGKTVTLAKNGGSSAVITPANGVTSTSNGAVVFTVTNQAAENVTFTATDVTDGIVLDPQSVSFDAPTATAGGISAGPSNVLNDGVATTTITVTLQDGLSRPSPGKLVSLAQGSGHSIITGPSPSVTNAAGMIQFTATDQVPETVTYTAVDLTDGNLPVPGSAVVTFGGQGSVSCVSQTPVTASAGFTLSTFATGFPTSVLSFGNVNWGCRGASNPAFTADGSVYIDNFPDGGVYKLPPIGGAASSSNKIATLGPSLFGPVIGKDGRIYAARGATTGNFFTGAIFELDPVTGAITRTVMANLTCPTGLIVDPLSGDLFVSDSCSGAGSDNPSLWRVSNPADPTPTLSVYTTLPGTPTGWIAIAPDGTIFMPQTITGASAPVLRISGTNIPGPPTQTPIPGLLTVYWVTVGETLPDGSAKSLIVLDPTPPLHLKLADITTNPPTFTDLIDSAIGSGVIGPDGCLYVTTTDSVLRLTQAGGGCGFTPTSHPPMLALSPASAAPTQGAAQTLVATFSNVAVPAGTGVSFAIHGANQQNRSALTDATGTATTTYQGISAGADQVVASAAVGVGTVTSNQATITWNAAGGRDASFISLNATVLSGPTGAAVLFSAVLFDDSMTPNVPVGSATLQFSLNGQTCNAVTNGSGVAACLLPLPASAGTYPLTVSFAGDATRAPTTAGDQVTVTAAGVPTPIAIVSRKLHGAAGTFDLPLSDVATNPTTEPRRGPCRPSSSHSTAP